jgi:hypothetical protein
MLAKVNDPVPPSDPFLQATLSDGLRCVNEMSSIILNRSFLDLGRFEPLIIALQAQPSSDHP